MLAWFQGMSFPLCQMFFVGCKGMARISFSKRKRLLISFHYIGGGSDIDFEGLRIARNATCRMLRYTIPLKQENSQIPRQLVGQSHRFPRGGKDVRQI
jgi:hypothetical protein